MVSLYSRAGTGLSAAAAATSWAARTARFGKQGAVVIPGLRTPKFLCTALFPCGEQSSCFSRKRGYLVLPQRVIECTALEKLMKVLR